MTNSLTCSEAVNNHDNLTQRKNGLPKRMTVNVSLCGSIPRSAIPSLHPRRDIPGDKKNGLSINISSLTVANGNNAKSLRIQKEESQLPLQVPNLNQNPAEKCFSLTRKITVVAQPLVVANSKLLSTITSPSNDKTGGACDTQDENFLAAMTQNNNTASGSRLNSEASSNPSIGKMLTDNQRQCLASCAQHQPPAISLQPRLRLGGISRLSATNESRCAVNATHRPEDSTPASQPSMEPPSWAVPAKGHAKLEPVCDTAKMHQAVDLTTNAHFRIGRSPASDVQLLHATSSRRHAMVFHHPNGSCYVVDCGSAHGTYVNGVRVKSTFPPAHSADGSSDSGNKSVVVPHRVRRGALIRFGGPGAPSFVLKSFAVDMKDIVGRATNAAKCKQEETPSCLPTLAPTSPTTSRAEEEPRNKCLPESQKKMSSSLNKTYDSGALVLLNTRLNAIGGAETLAPEVRKLARGALTKLSADFYAELKQQRIAGQTPNARQKRARQADDQLESKRRRSSLTCPSSPVASLDRPHPCLVSPCPSFVQLPHQPLFPPSAYTLTPAQQSFPLNAFGGGQQDGGRAPSPPILTLSSVDGLLKGTKQRRVQFSSEQPDCAYPHPVTPEELSGDENKDDESVNSEDSNAALECNTRTFALPPPPTTPRVVTLGA